MGFEKRFKYKTNAAHALQVSNYFRKNGVRYASVAF